MKTLLFAVAAICLPVIMYAQDITGLWTGTMKNDSTGQVQDYEVFISKEKGKYIGYSHTWFDIEGQKYYGVKKLKVSIAKDGKLVVLDSELKENNYPFKDKYVKQLNVLDPAKADETAELTGLFVTNCTKSFYELTGKVVLKKADTYATSFLMRYLEKETIGAIAVK